MFSDLSDSQSINDMISVPGTPGHGGPWPGPAGTTSGRFEKKGSRAVHGTVAAYAWDAMTASLSLGLCMKLFRSI